jgi:hypothetical protein
MTAHDVVEFITSSSVQVLFWGLCTNFAFLWVLYSWLNGSSRDPYVESRFYGTTLMIVQWAVNLYFWYINSIEWMLYSDAIFVFISWLIAKYLGRLWSIYLCVLFVAAFALDVAYRMGISQDSYSWMSNGIYAMQLLVVGGFLQNRSTKVTQDIKIIP